MGKITHKKKIKVCHITTVHPPLDGRIFHKECVSLAKAGFDVYLVAKNPPVHELDGVKFVALPEVKSRLKRILLLPWIALKKALSTKAEIYHFHDPELMFIGVVLKLLGKKVIYDVHEDLPATFSYKKWIKPPFLRKVLAAIAWSIEKILSLFWTGIVAATETIAEKFPHHKTITVRNYPILDMVEKSTPKEIPLPKTKNKTSPFIVIYAGGITKERGIYETVEALELTKGNVKLLLLGEFENEKLLKACQKLAGWNKVLYFGKVDLKEVYGYMKSAKAGIFVPHPTSNYLNSLPIKCFEYIACGIPLIVSDFPNFREIFDECAIYVPPHSPKEIAKGIDNLSQNKELYTKLKRNVLKLKRKFSWESEAEKLLHLYSRIADTHRPKQGSHSDS